MQKSSQILIRTQAAVRIVKSLDWRRQEQLRAAAAELALIERILLEDTKTPERRTGEVVLDILADTLASTLDKIDGIITEESES